MTTALRIKYNELIGALTFSGRFFVFAVKGFVLVVITMVGLMILLIFFFNIFLIASFLARLVGF